MKSLLLQTVTVGFAIILESSSASAWDFSFGYQNVFDANADLYIVGQQNVRKYMEWQSPPATYWGPSANDVQGFLTLRFDFAKPTASAFLLAETMASNYGPRGDYGFCSIWGSKDGTNWQLLQDNPIPSGNPISSDLFYNQLLPGSLLGGNSIWLQVRMQEHNAGPDIQPPTSSFADAQFSRFEQSGSNLFELDVSLVPEPAASALLALGLCAMAIRRLRKP